MMADDVTPMKARSFAAQASIALLCLVLFASVTFNFFGYAYSFFFAPLIIVYLWPRGADLPLTYVLLFCIGLVFDFLSGGTPGFWALVFLLGFATARPSARAKDVSLGETWLNFAIWLGVFVVIFMIADLAGVMESSKLPLISLFLANLIIFPALFRARNSVRHLLVGIDD